MYTISGTTGRKGWKSTKQHILQAIILHCRLDLYLRFEVMLKAQML